MWFNLVEFWEFMHDLFAFGELRKTILCKNCFILQPTTCKLQNADCGSLKFIICVFFIPQPAICGMRKHFFVSIVCHPATRKLRNADCGNNLIDLFCCVIPQPTNCGLQERFDWFILLCDPATRILLSFQSSFDYKLVSLSFLHSNWLL